MTSAVAALWSGWERRSERMLAGPLGASIPGVPFLSGDLGVDGGLVVEAAFGANPVGPADAWSWRDITRDVRTDPGIDFSLGRADEANTTQPAELSLVLDNPAGAYSFGGQSPNWPNVRPGVPIRFRVNPGAGAGLQVLFQGYANGWTPSWDTDAGAVPVVTLSASGVLRRLGSGKDPIRSALYRHLTLVEPTVEYWPLEESTTAAQGTSAAGGNPATFSAISSGGLLYGKVAWGGDTDNPAGARAVKVSAGGTITCPCRPSLFGTAWSVSWSMRYTSGSGGFFRVRTTSTAFSLGATLYTDGTVEFYNGASLILTWNQGDPVGWDNVWRSYTLSVSAANLWTIYRDGVSIVSGSAGATVAPPTSVEFQSAPNPGGVEDPMSIGHVAVRTGDPNTALLASASAAHRGELATARLVRLCAQESVPLEAVGTTPSTMGPQLPLAFLDLLRECETADQGILYDGVGPGLRYICRSARENAVADLTLDATQLVAPFAPAADDQRIRNRVTASAGSAAKVTVQDATGPMGTGANGIGIYDSSMTVNIGTDSEIGNYAGWAVRLGTVEGYRYPSVALNMRSAPILAPAVAALKLSSRVTVQNAGTVLAAMQAGDIDVLVEGTSMHFGPAEWTVQLKCSPFAPWLVGTLADDLGDVSEDVARLDTDGSTLSTDYPLGTVSVQVATPSGTLWSTVADDYPVTLNVAGVPVRATACSGASSPQTFTVDPLTLSRPSGAPVSVWNPPALAL